MRSLGLPGLASRLPLAHPGKRARLRGMRSINRSRNARIDLQLSVANSELLAALASEWCGGNPGAFLTELILGAPDDCVPKDMVRTIPFGRPQQGQQRAPHAFSRVWVGNEVPDRLDALRGAIDGKDVANRFKGPTRSQVIEALLPLVRTDTPDGIAFCLHVWGKFKMASKGLLAW
jgi:hypothetical protein